MKCSHIKTFIGVILKFERRLTIIEALLGVNFDKRHGLETATGEPRTGDERQTTLAK